MIRRPPRSPPFPHPPLFRSLNIIQSRDVINVVGEGALKSNTFPGRAGQGTRLETRLVVVAWVRNLAFGKSVWVDVQDRKSTRLNSSHGYISYAVFCLKKKND